MPKRGSKGRGKKKSSRSKTTRRVNRAAREMMARVGRFSTEQPHLPCFPYSGSVDPFGNRCRWGRRVSIGGLPVGSPAFFDDRKAATYDRYRPREAMIYATPGIGRMARTAAIMDAGNRGDVDAMRRALTLRATPLSEISRSIELDEAGFTPAELAKAGALLMIQNPKKGRAAMNRAVAMAARRDALERTFPANPLLNLQGPLLSPSTPFGRTTGLSPSLS